MFSNYFFLKRLVVSLKDELTGLSLLSAFSQNKNELILGFASEEKEFWVRANLDPNVSLLAFPESFARARKNSVDLFNSALGSQVVDCQVFDFERSFQLILQNNRSIIFKMHGRRANVLLAENESIVEIFRKNIDTDLELSVDNLHKQISVSKEAFQESNFLPTRLIPALGKEVRVFWEEHYENLEDSKKWEAFQSVLEGLDNNSIRLLTGDHPTISLLPIAEFEEETQDPIYATNWLYDRKAKSFYVDREKNQILSEIQQQIRKSESYIIKTSDKLKKVLNQRNPEEIANILMANLNLIQKGLSKVTLSDFYTNELIEIKLNPLLSAQKNAENFYRKSKNRHQEIEMLEKNIAAKERSIKLQTEKVQLLESLDNIKEIRKFAKSSAKSAQLSKKEKALPYHEFEYEGWEILVGKNAKANDELTLKVATKNDLWLHAKDVSGSHVVIRQRPGQNYPTHIVEVAAGIAAFNSKRKTDSLCPVIHTTKKFVRKSKGSPAGQVIVEKEEVIMTEPLDPSTI